MLTSTYYKTTFQWRTSTRKLDPPVCATEFLVVEEWVVEASAEESAMYEYRFHVVGDERFWANDESKSKPPLIPSIY
jgi:hypothetical protein